MNQRPFACPFMSPRRWHIYGERLLSFAKLLIAKRPTKNWRRTWTSIPGASDRYREASRAPICLDSPIGGDDFTPLGETVADENGAAPFDELLKDNDHDMVHQVLATLDARESKLLRMRFGLDDGTPKTLEEVAEHLGITHERIRQIQVRALEKMRQRIEKRDRLSNRFPPSNGFHREHLGDTPRQSNLERAGQPL